MDDAELDFLAHINAEQRILERFDSTGNVALDDEVEGVDLAFLEDLVEVLEGDALAALGEHGLSLCGFALIGDLACGALVGGDEERITRTGNRREAENSDRA